MLGIWGRISQNSRDRLIKWLFFVVIGSMFPFATCAVMWIASHSATKESFHLYYVLERGELLALAIGFAIDALGECFVRSDQWFFTRLFLAMGCLTITFAETLWFAAILSFPEAYSPRVVSIGSIVAFVVTILAALMTKTCAALIEESRK